MHEIITPIQYSKSQIRMITYERISKKLNKEKVLGIWKLANAKEIPEVIEDKQVICFQYPNKPIIIIRKRDGKLCCLTKHSKWVKHQAFIVLSILNSFGLVEGFKRETVSMKYPKVEWK